MHMEIRLSFQHLANTSFQQCLNRQMRRIPFASINSYMDVFLFPMSSFALDCSVWKHHMSFQAVVDEPLLLGLLVNPHGYAVGIVKDETDTSSIISSVMVI